jgi:hypothetical protein
MFTHMHSVLLIPELRIAIFEHLDNPSHAAATHVCQAWLRPAISVLWRSPKQFGRERVLPHRWHLYEAAICILNIDHPDDHEDNYLYDPRRLRPEAEEGFSDVYRADMPFGSLTEWHFPRLWRVSYSHCLLWTNGPAERGDEADELSALLERCGPALAAVKLDCCYDCYGDHPVADLVATSNFDASGNNAVANMLDVMYLAGLLNFASRANIHRLDSLLALRWRDIDAVRTAVCRPFPRLRKLFAYVTSHGDVRSLVAMLTAAAIDLAKEEVEEGGNKTAPALTRLQLKIVHSDHRPIVHLLAPLGRNLRDLCLIVMLPPDKARIFAATDIRALGRLPQLRSVLIKAVIFEKHHEWLATNVLDEHYKGAEDAANKEEDE